MTRHISHTEISTLAHCERRWAYRYLWDADERPSEKRELGSDLHACLAAWWRGESVAPVVSQLGHSDDDSDLAWLMARYVEHYGNRPTTWDVVAVEQAVEVPVAALTGLAGDNVVFKAVIDAAFIDEQDRFWIAENKSYGSQSRLDTALVSPQETLYWLAAKYAFGRTPHGVLLNGVYTYRWKRPRPVEDSFQRVWSVRTEEQIRFAVQQIEVAIDLRADLKSAFGRAPLANIGFACNACGYRERCWSEVVHGTEPLEVVGGQDDELV